MTSCTRCRVELRPGANYCHMCGAIIGGVYGPHQSLAWFHAAQRQMDADRAILSSRDYLARQQQANRDYLARQQDMNAAMLPTMPLGVVLARLPMRYPAEQPKTQPEPPESLWRAFWRWLGFD